MELINWNPNNDKYLKKGEIDIHNKFHKQRSVQKITKWHIFESDHRKFRIKSFEKALRRAKTKIHGNVLELGAGDGWCSAYMLKNYKLNVLYTMEINPSALEYLIPKVFEVSGVETDNVKLVLGSFNNIQKENFFDFVVVMGALHHSSNLFETFKNIYKSLKPGGWLISQEPYMINSTRNSFYFERDKEEVNFKGILKVKNSDRTDIFFRDCEYRVAGFHAGFDFHSEVVYKEERKSFLGLKAIKKKEKIGNPNNLIIYAQKPENGYKNLKPVTAWEY